MSIIGLPGVLESQKIEYRDGEGTSNSVLVCLMFAPVKAQLRRISVEGNLARWL